MPSYSLKCRKTKKQKKTLIQKFQKLTMVKQWYQNLQYVVVKNQDLLKNKMQEEY